MMAGFPGPKLKIDDSIHSKLTDCIEAASTQVLPKFHAESRGDGRLFPAELGGVQPEPRFDQNEVL
jgi:hypothetical protein